MEPTSSMKGFEERLTDEEISKIIDGVLGDTIDHTYVEYDLK